MENYDLLLEEIKGTVGKISDLYDLAYTQYASIVDEVLAGRLTTEKQIEQILDGILDFGDDLRFLELSKKLCRHIYLRRISRARCIIRDSDRFVNRNLSLF